MTLLMDEKGALSMNELTFVISIMLFAGRCYIMVVCHCKSMAFKNMSSTSVR